MKKIIGFLSLFLVVFSLNSCGGPDPRKFNDELMASLNGADSGYNTFYSLMEQFSKNDNFTSMSKKGKEGIEQMKKRIEEINSFKVPKEGDEFKSACIDYINIMINSMKGFVSEGELTRSQFDKAVKNLEDNEEKLNVTNEKIIETQRVFAEKRGFQLKEISQKK